MTSCASELMQKGWERMQAEGIAQDHGHILHTDNNGKILAACALGAIVLGTGEERAYLDGAEFLSSICPILDEIMKEPSRGFDRYVEEVIWEINDGWWVNDEMMAAKIDDPYGETIVPIPLIIAYLQEQGR